MVVSGTRFAFPFGAFGQFSGVNSLAVKNFRGGVPWRGPQGIDMVDIDTLYNSIKGWKSENPREIGKFIFQLLGCLTAVRFGAEGWNVRLRWL